MDETKTAEQRRGGDTGFEDQRSTVVTEIAIAFPVAVALWLATYFGLPPLAGMEETLARLVFALKCSCIAILFCFLTGIEAVAHERLRSPAIDPLSGYETLRMTINLRYLQNTLEQLMLFIPVCWDWPFIVRVGGRCERLWRRPRYGSSRGSPSGSDTSAVHSIAPLEHRVWRSRWLFFFMFAPASASRSRELRVRSPYLYCLAVLKPYACEPQDLFARECRKGHFELFTLKTSLG
jgi:hypothetical protein